MGRGWIGVDLDGTLAEQYWPHKGEYDPLRIGDPIPAMVERVCSWLAMGQEVRIFTARVGPQGSAPGWPGGAEQREQIAKAISTWTRRHFGVPLDATCTKDYGMIALYDDRAFRVERNTGRIIEPSHE
jgi:hypothetical protein